jgi:hypothetical protein
MHARLHAHTQLHMGTAHIRGGTTGTGSRAPSPSKSRRLSTWTVIGREFTLRSRVVQSVTTHAVVFAVGVAIATVRATSGFLLP